MNTSNLKSYAPQARKDFIAAVTGRANLLGLSEAKGQLVVAEAKISGDLVMIAGRPWPVKVNEQRNKLIARMQQQGFGRTVEAVAYAWFNRLAALRYMEIHDYLGHGRRVLSNPQGGLPEVLAHALDLAESNALPGLSADIVRELKLANQDPELYRLILIAQCNALHQAMPFLFEQLGDETELLLPENLLLTDSVVAKLVQSIPEEDWQQIEIIGWLYQFYISEKKDQVIGKVVKSEDIPAATQLFTPNWIVKYIVQNSLGAQWLATYPDSPLKAQMAYYIEPTVQTDEVNAQLAAITPSSLNPEKLTLIDPASGSGHILVEAYDLFKAIYLERGYRQRDVAKLILEKNLFGLDIDERAAQLTGFALMMKGRADDRQLFERGVRLNVIALVDSARFDAEGLAKVMELGNFGLKLGDITGLKRLFEHAATFGSLIQVPEELEEKLPALKLLSEASNEDIFVSAALKLLGPLVRQAELLAAHYDAVVANPPYMGSKFYCAPLKQLVNEAFKAGKADLYGAFTIRNVTFSKAHGYIGMITIPNWMFLSAFEELRKVIFNSAPLTSMIHNGRGVWGSDFGSCAFTLRRKAPVQFTGSFMRLFDKQGSVASNDELIQRFHSRMPFTAKNSDFVAIPGSPVAYWVSQRVRDVYVQAQLLRSIAMPRQGIKTGDNERFLRQWFEVSQDKSATLLDRAGDTKWFPCTKGGAFRKWYGNHEYVLNWERDGSEIRNFIDDDGRLRSRPQNTSLFFRAGATWSTVSIAALSMRKFPPSFVFESKGSVCFPNDSDDLNFLLALLNSKVVARLLAATSPSVDFSEGAIGALPVRRVQSGKVQTEKLVELAQIDWDSYESSWDFQFHPLLATSSEAIPTLGSSYANWIAHSRDAVAEMKRLEEENNRLFIEAYSLQEELTPDVPVEQISLTVNPAYRYGGKLTEEELWTRLRQDTLAELVSYSIGCMMGRYSLNAPGLIYASSGNVGFDASRYTKYPADADGIVPVTDELWFEDDAALRVREFLLAVWGKDSLEQNMVFLADNLGRKTSESPEQAIRRYLADTFFKDHLQTYKKRPIYWLFSSGRQGAFQALVYLHRYNAGTLSRLRAEYVVPLTGKMQGKIEALEQDIAASSSIAQRNKLTKQLEKLRKQHLELLAYDEQLRHYADQRITLDLDDGVKANYGKFGDLLADVRSVVGKQEED